jgi:predicted TIM-barrel fold metal-dependent hydrolase
MDPDESLGPDTVRRVGAQCFVWNSDYPHWDVHLNAIVEIRESVAELPQADQRMILGDNAAKVYHLV